MAGAGLPQPVPDHRRARGGRALARSRPHVRRPVRRRRGRGVHGAPRPRARAPRCRPPLRHCDHQSGPRRRRVDRAPARPGVRPRLRARPKSTPRSTGNLRRPTISSTTTWPSPAIATSCWPTARSRCGARSRRRRRCSSACATPRPGRASTTPPTREVGRHRDRDTRRDRRPRPRDRPIRRTTSWCTRRRVGTSRSSRVSACSRDSSSRPACS